MRNRLVVFATVVGLVVAATAQAGHHLWDFTEIFSNASGSVQFVELYTAEDNEQGVGPFTVVQGANTFNFVTNLSTSVTADTYILIATAGFGSLKGGVTPDYILPGSFFATGGGQIRYAGSADIWNYGAVPTNGVLALQRNGTSQINSPTNFAGDEGAVDVSASVPAAGGWGMALLIGAILFAGSGLLRRRQSTTA